MTSNPKPIRASKEVIWHLTCGECGNYWTYPSMELNQNLIGKSFHCPLCGTKSQVAEDDSLRS